MEDNTERQKAPIQNEGSSRILPFLWLGLAALVLGMLPLEGWIAERALPFSRELDAAAALKLGKAIQIGCVQLLGILCIVFLDTRKTMGWWPSVAPVVVCALFALFPLGSLSMAQTEEVAAKKKVEESKEIPLPEVVVR